MTQEVTVDLEASFSHEDLQELTSRLRGLLDIRNRRYGFPPQTYEQCFVGSEAVSKLVEANIASNVDDAIRIGGILQRSGIFHHVVKEHDFKNEELFYRFASDEDHGRTALRSDGKPVSWGDFLSPLLPANRGDASLFLQSTIPERDLDLASHYQVDLDACGLSPLDEHNIELLDNTHPKAWKNPTAKPKYNMVVIGAGAGGLVSSSAAAGVGARVALIESHLLGGDCLNVGCVPSKALLRCAKMAHSVRDAARFGIHIEGEISVDFGAVMERMRRLRSSIAPVDSARRFSEDLGVDVFLGKGKFTGKNTVEVGGQTLHFSKAVIATGGTAAVPGNIPGLQGVSYLTNATIFNLTKLPRRLGVIGSGPIGLELAQAFQRFGSQVTVFSRGEEIMRREDPEAAKLVEESMLRDGVRFIGSAIYKNVSSEGEGQAIQVELEGGTDDQVFEFDALLVATGRKPSVHGLGLDEAGVQYDARMGVQVNDRLQTTNPSIFAVGDVASVYQFTHTADFMARLVVRNALFLGRDRYSKLLIPWATYTDPEVAHVGLYERDLRERGIEFATYERDFSEVDRAILEGETGGFVKIHVKKDTDEIVGATIVGSHAGDMISEISVAMQAGMGLGALASVIHPYPTLAEAIRQCGDAYNRTRLTSTIKAVFRRLMAIQR